MASTFRGSRRRIGGVGRDRLLVAAGVEARVRRLQHALEHLLESGRGGPPPADPGAHARRHAGAGARHPGLRRRRGRVARDEEAEDDPEHEEPGAHRAEGHGLPGPGRGAIRRLAAEAARGRLPDRTERVELAEDRDRVALVPGLEVLIVLLGHVTRSPVQLELAEGPEGDDLLVLQPGPLLVRRRARRLGPRSPRRTSGRPERRRPARAPRGRGSRARSSDPARRASRPAARARPRAARARLAPTAGVGRGVARRLAAASGAPASRP